MSGTRITDQQVRLYMNKRKHHPQELAAAKAGISVRSARRIERDATLPSQKPQRSWRTRPDPFADVWDSEVVPLLRNAPHLMGITILRKLQDDHPGCYPDSMRRTLERRISQWRALEGPSQEIFFPQEHQPGVRGLSDFTDMSKLCVTIGSAPFEHRLYHFVLAFSRWEYACVVEGGESFEALANGLQNALWQAGGCPREHRTDSLSAAFKNLGEKEDFTTRYKALLDHYEMRGTRNNRGLGHENGSVESSHRYLKDAVDQALMLRGHRDFVDRAAYDEFIREQVMRRNRRCAAAFLIERQQLQDLPEYRTTDFVEEEAPVTRCSTFTVRGILYSAPSRLIGHRLKVRIYGDRLDCYLSGVLVHSTARGSRAHDNRHALDYRHFIDSLKRKPQAFKGLAFRDALFPRDAYRRTWEQLDARLSQRDACKTMVGLLELAGLHGVEAVLAGQLDAMLETGELPDLQALREQYAPREAQCPDVEVQMPPVAVYDELLEKVAA
ncbi:IS21 family transposase [Burkholderia pseudomultivorans]|uniref:IS21 family transposase n=1 Tax=Burkholderia pseudomultivorans TaxID=1207504 RepID=UPI00287525F5|nr:IS21 family transposase [Burkholderia pseudomultivorans]MDS0862969.1 IS21 family transposase [Burkholderia pseudomultivorans]